MGHGGVDLLGGRRLDRHQRRAHNVLDPAQPRQGVFRPAQARLDEQRLVQRHQPILKLQRLVINRMLALKKEHGLDTICIYCNSMSTAIDLTDVAAETGLKIVTPLEVYRLAADQYRTIGLMAANCQSLAGIEKVIQEQNEAAQVIGAAMLEIAIEIEQKTDPRQIVRSLGLVNLIRFFEAADVEVLVLGCTHFPYLQSTLEGLTSLPILNPAAEMVRLCQT